ncbi:MAG TPA: transposase [Thermodesulfobacteriota bacterium]|nr:transposase [Thermodesulfobacteriota bacterium]
MSRPLRIEYAGAFYLVTSRGNERKTIFKSNRDKEKYLSYLESAHERYGAVIHVYCLMRNHYHLLLETPRANLSKILHHINGAYASYFNLKRSRSGHLFQGRFEGILVDKEEYGKALSRYIHLDPVRTGLVKTPWEYPWSSYRYFAGQEKKPNWLTTEWVLGDFGGEREEGFGNYREYVERGADDEIENPLERVVASTLLGSDKFINRIKAGYLEKKRIDWREIPVCKKLLIGPALETIEKAVIKVLGTNHPYFRKSCIYLSYQHSGRSLEEIGRYFGMQRSAISQLSRRFGETLRKDPELSKILRKIEQAELILGPDSFASHQQEEELLQWFDEAHEAEGNEAPWPQVGDSREGNFLHIVPPDPAYLGWGRTGHLPAKQD